MNYSENNKTYGRKVLRKNKRKQFIFNTLLFIIGLSIGSLMISGIIHIFCCRCINVVEATVTEPKEVVKVVEEPKIQKISLGEYKLTAYCACMKCCGKTDGITASGVRAKEGVTVAADSALLFGTKILIDNHEYIVQDRGGAIKGNRIDLCFNSNQEALNFGRRQVKVYILK